MKRLLFTAALALVAQPCSGMFCDQWVVSEGDTQVEVLKRCGEPDYVTGPEYRYVGTRDRHVDFRRTTGADWIYNFGPRQFVYTVTFEGAVWSGLSRGTMGGRDWEVRREQGSGPGGLSVAVGLSHWSIP